MPKARHHPPREQRINHMVLRMRAALFAVGCVPLLDARRLSKPSKPGIIHTRHKLNRLISLRNPTPTSAAGRYQNNLPSRADERRALSRAFHIVTKAVRKRGCLPCRCDPPWRSRPCGRCGRRHEVAVPRSLVSRAHL